MKHEETCEQDERIKRKRKKVKQWIKDCISYWSDRVDEMEMGADWSEADVVCWRCGHIRQQQKCHIVPKSLGGSDDASNVIPLCAMCHDEMPNVNDPKCVWEWIRKDHGILYDTYWTARAIKESGLTDEEIKRFSLKKFMAAFDDCGTHFGQCTGGARMTPATTAWAIKKACET